MIFINKLNHTLSVIRPQFASALLNKHFWNINKSNERHLCDAKESESKDKEICQKSETYDIIINGGGIVGFALLASLQSSPFLRERKILLFERQSKPKELNRVTRGDSRQLLSNRVSSLTRASIQFFNEIGIWNEIKHLAKPIKSMYVWNHAFREAITFKSSKHNLFFNNYSIDDDNVCYVIENNVIMESLRSVIERSGICVCYSTGVTDVIGDGNYVNVTSKCDSNDYINHMKSSLLIGCDGFDSIVRQKSNLKVYEEDLESCGIVGTVTVSNDDVNNEIAWQRFAPIDNTVVALLPLTREKCSFVISTSKQRANRLMQLNDDEFVDEMNRLLSVETSNTSSFGNTCDKFINSIFPYNTFVREQRSYSLPHVLSIDPESRASFPLKFSTTLPYLIGSPKGFKNNKIAIIGDAAHRVHPLAGQGLNLGIGDAHVLSKCLHESLSRGENLFDNSEELVNCLFNFERKRQLKLVPMMAAIHSMQQLFNIVPSRALTVFNSFGLVKEQIVGFANTN